MSPRSQCLCGNPSSGTPNPASTMTFSGGDSLRSLAVTNPMKQIIVREEKEARNAAEKVCKEKSAELERIQDKKSAAERMGTNSSEDCSLFVNYGMKICPRIHVIIIMRVAMTHPMAVTNYNIDMESLISGQNRSIATLAITTLLKTGNESSVDHLMKQITNFMSDIADEFKIVVVEAIRSLFLKFPLKYRSLMNFLSNILREEGGFDYKKAIVDSIVILIRDIPDTKESDCSIFVSSLKIVNSLICPHRVHLENATVRASAVSTLTKFGAAVDELKLSSCESLVRGNSKASRKYYYSHIPGIVIKSVDRELTIGTLNFLHHTQQKMEDTAPIFEEGVKVDKASEVIWLEETEPPKNLMVKRGQYISTTIRRR
ncbi:hypothetical protein Ahy_A04g018876 [Arachis hypogaea]|uniref:Clathrin/coatomer adaptor adaptin-like N-terminal domain-containing protein n=1 Tax=Arachis hypogaea TaxID=3818 RepID=A0A445DER1_ARAHY|nr:hypothetical protein Ahy_A04g018876 [Arachis hypogaea]